jgi:hypothetical protein
MDSNAEIEHREIGELRTKPPLAYLRQLMGDGWIDANVFGDHPKHLLGQWWKKDDQNPWVAYTETLVEAILTSEKIQLDRVALGAKLKPDYLSTLAEMETAVFLLQQGFSVVLEPTYPEKGPDLRADWQGTPHFVEVKTVVHSEEDSRFKGLSNEIMRKLNSIPSSYSVAITVGDMYLPRTQPFKWAIEAIVKSLEILKEEKWKGATLYYSEGGKLLNPHGDFSGSRGSAGSIRAKHQAIVDSADFIARFRNVGEERSSTFSWIAREQRAVPQADKSHERLKGILDKKRKQLPKDSRGIIVIDRSELFMLTDFAIEAALYGNMVVRIGAPKTPGGPLGDATAARDHRGIFAMTSRISAVVIHERRVEGSDVKNDWKVYPTDRANADTIRLTLEELRRFGDLGDRTNLCAENAPNVTDQSTVPAPVVEKTPQF